MRIVPRYVVWAVFRAFGDAGATAGEAARCLSEAGLVSPRSARQFIDRTLRKLRPIRGRRRIIDVRGNGRYVARLVGRDA